MKPKPFSLLNHFTVPVAMGSSFQSSQPARGSALVVTVISRLLLRAKHQGTDTNRCNVPPRYTTGCLGVPRRGCWGARACRPRPPPAPDGPPSGTPAVPGARVFDPCLLYTSDAADD